MEIVQRCDQSLDNLKTVLCLAQGVARPADQGEFPVVEEGLQQLTQGKLLRLPIDQCKKDGAEVALQSRASLQLLQHLVWIGITA